MLKALVEKVSTNIDNISKTLLEAEMDEHLGYSKYDYKNKDTGDSRNGYSKKT